MQTRPHTPRWIITALAVVAILVVTRYLMAVESGVSPAVALRTYAFWALVVTPTAYLGDVLLRTILNYRVVQLTLARVQSRR